MTKIDETKEKTDCLSNELRKLVVNTRRIFDVSLQSKVILSDYYPLGAHSVSTVQSKDMSTSRAFQMYYFYGKSNRGNGFICYTEVVRFSD